jgi:hypothetical protein
MSNATRRLPYFQFSLSTALLAMTWVALVCVAVTTKTRLWLDLIGLVSLLALSTAVLVGIYGAGQSRAFAVGFALFGFLFFVCLHRFDGYSPRLLPRYFGEAAVRMNHPAESAEIAFIEANKSTLQRFTEERDRLVEISQGVAVLLSGIAGGLLGRYLHNKRQQQQGVTGVSPGEAPVPSPPPSAS